MRHGGHQVAQKSTISTLPSKSASLKAPPAGLDNVAPSELAMALALTPLNDDVDGETGCGGAALLQPTNASVPRLRKAIATKVNLIPIINF